MITLETLITIFLLGIVATIAIDCWAIFTSKVLKLPRTSWAMVGRWLGHIPKGKLIHTAIKDAAPIRHELLLGWVFHYLIGIAYAALYVALVNWCCGGMPTLLSGWLFGVATVVAPWFVMQPGLGAGICARKTPKPTVARLQNLTIHSIFGVVLYLSWIIIAKFI